jgi:hypothetical protein
LTDRWFTVEKLAGKRVPYLKQHEPERFPYLFDHSYYFREAQSPYRPAAVAAHLYGNSAAKPGDLAETATGLGLVLDWVTDFPSWWYPGWTSLALITPARALSRQAA